MTAKLYYAHDPMCSWCWAFRSSWEELSRSLPDDIRVQRLLGGLAADNDQPMPEALRRHLQDTWRRIETRVPGVRFNFDFWELCRPRRSTYPACRAVIAARQQDSEAESVMILAIQRAYYVQARNPSDQATLIELALESGLDPARFLSDLKAPATQEELKCEITLYRSLGLSSFPSLVLEIGDSRWPVGVDYGEPRAMLKQIQLLVAWDRAAPPKQIGRDRN